jgi:hypothetical protein
MRLTSEPTVKRAGPVFNPFYDIVKADDIPVEQVKKFFVREASPVWEEAQQAVNQIIRGPRGAGKTILLKQLSYTGGACNQGYIGVYIQISRVANIFRHLFPKPERADRSTIETAYQTAFADYLVLELIKELVKALGLLAREKPLSRFDPSLFGAILDRATQASSVDEVTEFCITKQCEIETESREWEVQQSCKWKPLFEPSAALNRIAGVATSAFGVDYIYFLLDESAPISIRCQQVVNFLLQRGRAFRTKLAVRPYEWESLDTYQGVRLETGTDFRRLELIHPDELTEDYVEKARLILNRILAVKITASARTPAGWPSLPALDIEEVFPSKRGFRTYSGLRDICALSSSNPQNLLSICSQLFSRARREDEWIDCPIPAVPHLLQHDSMIAWAKEQEHTIPDPAVQSFTKALLKIVSQGVSEGKGASVHVANSNPDLFPMDELPSDVAALLKPGFAFGFFRVNEVSSLLPPWSEVPSRFTISRSLLPIQDIELRVRREPPIEIDLAFVRDHAREHIGGSAAKKDDLLERKLMAFLSTSFSGAIAAGGDRCHVLSCYSP